MTNPKLPWTSWSHSLQTLLEDETGSELFEKYLEDEGASVQLNFIYAVDGLKSTAEKDRDNIPTLIHSILGLSQGLIGLTPPTRKTLNDLFIQSGRNVSQTSTNLNIFDQVLQEVKSHLSKTFYPAFLKSDLFIRHVAKYYELHGRPRFSSTSNPRKDFGSVPQRLKSESGGNNTAVTTAASSLHHLNPSQRALAYSFPQSSSSSRRNLEPEMMEHDFQPLLATSPNFGSSDQLKDSTSSTSSSNPSSTFFPLPIPIHPVQQDNLPNIPPPRRTVQQGRGAEMEFARLLEGKLKQVIEKRESLEKINASLEADEILDAHLENVFDDRTGEVDSPPHTPETRQQCGCRCKQCQPARHHSSRSYAAHGESRPYGSYTSSSTRLSQTGPTPRFLDSGIDSGASVISSSFGRGTSSQASGSQVSRPGQAGAKTWSLLGNF